MNNNENPFVEKSTGIVGKIRTKFGAKKAAAPIENPNTGIIRPYLVGMNNWADVCSEACACCWDKVVPEGFENVAEYIAKRTRIGHTSVIEHSNFVLYISIDKFYEEDLIEFLSWNRYLETVTAKSDDGSRWHLLIGGSFRGFSDLYREAEDLNNPVLKAITGSIYRYSHSALFEDIIKLGLLDKTMFNNAELDENFNLLTLDGEIVNDTDLYTVKDIGDIRKLYTNIFNIDEEFAKKLTTYDLIKFVTITVLFKNMSRTCTHQLVRHRNAITQESQRYVDYSKACFSSPEMFKPEKYDGNHKYTIRFGPSSQLQMTLSEIGEATCNIYEMLRNPVVAGADYALLKEDARAFLPSNVQCRKIYVTFTYKNFIKFLDLREEPAAQAEIRKYASAVGEFFRTLTKFDSKELIKLYTNPRLLIEDPWKIDAYEGIVEETIEMDEKDIMKSAGFDEDVNLDSSDIPSGSEV